MERKYLRTRVVVITPDYRMPQGSQGVIIGRMNGMIVVDFGTGFGVLMDDELEVVDRQDAEGLEAV